MLRFFKTLPWFLLVLNEMALALVIERRARYSREWLSAFEDCQAFLDRFNNKDVLDCCRFNFQRVFVENHQVR